MKQPDLSYIADDLRQLAVPLEEVVEDPHNARRHNDRNVEAIAESLRRFGQRKPIVVNRRTGGTTEAGSGTIRAARALGWSHIAVVWADDDEATAQAFALADNRTAELAEWDPAVLLRQLSESETDMTPFWTDEETEAMLAKANAPTGEPEEVEPSENDPERSQLGDIWQLGPHRLAVGDSRDENLVARLFGEKRHRMVWTDPPYGIAYVGKTAEELTIENDALTEAETEELVASALKLSARFGVPGAGVYVACPGGKMLPRFIAALQRSGYTYKHSLVWVKHHFVMGRADYHYRHELILYGWKEDGAHYFVDNHRKDSVFEVDRPSRSRAHPTMKPKGLVQQMVENSSKPREIVYDAFAGSGTTLLACERSKRICYAVELDPRYADVILRRYEEETGQPATKTEDAP